MHVVLHGFTLSNVVSFVIMADSDLRKWLAEPKKVARDRNNSRLPEDLEPVTGISLGTATRPKEHVSPRKKLKQDHVDSDDDFFLIDDVIPAPKTTNSESSVTNTGKLEKNCKPMSVVDLLMQIPDAPLPEVTESKKFNFADIARHNGADLIPSSPIDIPEAAENCLQGLTFVFTGILPHLNRDIATDLVRRYGGKVTTSPSRRTTCVVLGEDAGPRKIATIKQKGIKTITEDGFLQLLRKMPANGGNSEASRKADEQRKRNFRNAQTLAASMNPSMSKQGSDSHFQEGQEGSQQMLWTDIYAPKKLSEICGNTTSVQRLVRWLKNWPENRRRGFKPGFGDGSEFRAVMLHGPPGIGKTTAAVLVAKEEGYDYIEYNASDTRSKSLLQDTVLKTLSNTTVLRRNQGQQGGRLCMILDEVDGMSSGDRGGVGAMAQFARTTNLPLILICNERSLPKMRPFDRVCYDIPFRRPDISAIRQRLTAIALSEGVILSPGILEQLVTATRGDIRQMINFLSMYSRTAVSVDPDGGRKLSKSWQKEIVLKPFDIVGRYLSTSLWSASSNSTLDEKIGLYFDDYDFAPLMVQENYLNTVPARSRQISGGSLELAAQAADIISRGDLVDRMIHGSQQQWSLMPLHAVLSCVIPSSLVFGQVRARLNFTCYLGNMSKMSKFKRLLADLQAHMRLRLWASPQELRLDYQYLLSLRLLAPLLSKGVTAIDEVIHMMDSYMITRDDLDVLIELDVGPNSLNSAAKKLPTTVKTAFTRKYNKSIHPQPFMKTADTKRTAIKREVPDFDEIVADDVGADYVEEAPAEDSIEAELINDKNIVRPKPKVKSRKKAEK